MGWLGTIAFILLGAFIGIVINSSQKAKGTLLQQDFIKMGNLVGLSLDEIKRRVGEPSGMTACTVAATGRSGALYTWAQYPYSITLLFDENNKCLGVNKEMTIK
jgi:hypothetical protein